MLSYYAEIEKERRVRKRRSRLEAAVEDAFTLVQRQRSSASSASDVASEVWPTMARSMQKYLRTTRQHEHYNQEDCLGLGVRFILSFFEYTKLNI